jgi:hypothetical protein
VYLGGRPQLVSSWKLLSGRFITDPDTTIWGTTQAGATWFNVTQNVVKVWSGSEVLTISSSPKTRLYNYIFDYDDFISGGYALFSATGGKLGWLLNQSGTGMFESEHTSGHPGIMSMQTGATGGSKAFMYIPSSTSNTGWTEFGDSWNITFLISVTAVSNMQIQIGQTSNVSSFASGAYIEKLFADTNVFAVCNDGGASTRVFLFTPIVGAWYYVGIRKSGTSVIFSLNNVDILTISTNILSAVTSVASCFSIENNAASDKRLLVDYFDLTVTGVYL